jgi:hypothetical protein
MIKIHSVSHGQPRAYADSYDVYLVESDEGFGATKAHCVKEFGVENEASHENQGGYPFGLDSYFWFGARAGEPGRYTFKVTSPYDD